MSNHARSLAIVTVFAAILLSGGFCADKEDILPPEIGRIPDPTSPENLVTALEFIYNDPVSNAIERRQEYQNLFPPSDHDLGGFIFRLQPVDAGELGIASWGLDQEIRIHEGLFNAQESRDIFSLTLNIENQAAVPLEFPEPGQEEWRMVFATDVNLRLLFSPEDGLEVVGGQAEFLAAPADGRWYLTEWKDLPRPVGRRS